MKLLSILGYWKAIAFLATFIFLGCKPDPIVTIPVVETVSVTPYSNNFRAIGKVVFDGGGDIYEKGFCLSLEENPGIEDKKYQGLSHSYSDPSLFSAIINDIAPNQTYYLRFYAINAIGVGYGDVLTFTDSFKPLVITQTATDITKTEAVLKGVVNPINTEARCWFEYWSEGEEVRKSELPQVSGDQSMDLSVKIEGLTLAKVYNYTLKSSNKFGESSGDTLQFETYAINDYDGNLYRIVKIGNQVWMKENFRGAHYSNGDPILYIKNIEEWKNSNVGAYCWYQHDPKNGVEYGGLYNWSAANDSRALITGWHLPNREDFDEFTEFIDNGDMNSTGIKIMETGTSHWLNPRLTANNQTGFTALPNGFFNPDDGDKAFSGLGTDAIFWGSDIFFGGYNLAIISNCLFTYHGYTSKKYLGCGVRLIKD